MSWTASTVMTGFAIVAASVVTPSFVAPATAQTITNYDPPTRYGRTEDVSPQPRPYFSQPFTHPDEQPPVTYDRNGRPRITVLPNRKLVRACTDGYVVERRPSGDTVVPRLQCRWAYQ